MVTLRDIAEYAGVSVATVSNVLSGRVAVREDKQAKVLEAVKVLGYTPNYAARRLKEGKSNMVGVLLYRTGPQADAVEEALTAGGYQSVLRLSSGDPLREAAALRMFESFGVAGLIIEPCGMQCCEQLAQMQAKGITVLTIGSEVASIPSVTTDDGELAFFARSAYEARRKCHGGIVLTRDTDATRYKNCTEGYLRCGQLPVYSVDLRNETAFRQIVELLNRLDNWPETVFAADEPLADMLHETAELYGKQLHVVYPAQMYLDGESMHPYLRNTEYLGNTAAQTLMRALKEEKLEGKKVRQTILHRSAPTLCSSRKVHVRLFDGPTAKTFLEMIPPFSARTGIEVSYELLKYQELYDAVRRDEKRADMYMIDDSWINSVSEYFVPLKNVWEAGTILPHVKKAPVRPLMVNMQLFFYRKELFESPALKRAFNKAYGLPLEPPKTWREFANLAEFFAFSPESPVLYGTTLQGWDVITLTEEFYPRQWAYGGQLVRADGQITANSPANCRALENFCRTYACTPKEQITNSWEREAERLVRGEIAMYFTFATHVPHDENIGIAPAPGRFSMAGGWYLGVDRQSDARDAAMQLLDWATGPENARVNTMLGNFVPYPHILESEICRRAHPWLAMVKRETIRERERLITRKGRAIEAMEIDTLLFEALLQASRGGQSVKKVLDRFQEQMETLLR